MPLPMISALKPLFNNKRVYHFLPQLQSAGLGAQTCSYLAATENDLAPNMAAPGSPSLNWNRHHKFNQLKTREIRQTCTAQYPYLQVGHGKSSLETFARLVRHSLHNIWLHGSLLGSSRCGEYSRQIIHCTESSHELSAADAIRPKTDQCLLD